MPENGFELSLIDSAGLKNVGLAGTIKGLLLLPKSYIEAGTIIKEFQPDVVIGAGGYVTGACCFDGEHEENSDSGDGFKRASGIYKSAIGKIC